MPELTVLSNLKIDKQNLKTNAINFIVPLVCLVITILLFVFVIYPSYVNMPVLREQLITAQTLRNTLSEKQLKISRLSDFKSILEEDSMLVDKVMPSVEDVPGILDQIDLIARESGLSVDRLSYSFSDGSSSSDASKPAFGSVLVTLGAEGTTSQMLTFLKNAENAARLVTVSNYRYNLANANDDATLSLIFNISAPYLKVQSNAVTDDPINLDITSARFTNFITYIKALRYYKELTPSAQSEARKTAQESSESTSSNR